MSLTEQARHPSLEGPRGGRGGTKARQKRSGLAKKSLREKYSNHRQDAAEGPGRQKETPQQTGMTSNRHRSGERDPPGQADDYNDAEHEGYFVRGMADGVQLVQEDQSQNAHGHGEGQKHSGTECANAIADLQGFQTIAKYGPDQL